MFETIPEINLFVIVFYDTDILKHKDLKTKTENLSMKTFLFYCESIKQAFLYIYL